MSSPSPPYLFNEPDEQARGVTPAGVLFVSFNAWALVTGTAYVASPGEQVNVNTAGNTTVTLPDATTCIGKRIRIQDATGGAAGHNITIAATSAQTINGQAASTFSVTANNGGLTVVSNGASWFVS